MMTNHGDVSPAMMDLRPISGKTIEITILAWGSAARRGRAVLICLVTFGFVRQAKGLLARAQWSGNVVIDFDGTNVESSHEGYKKVVKALDDAGIAFTRHWYKANNLVERRLSPRILVP
ncbi:hypothetical protein [Parasphingorhabdus sp.]|uniref:hypothetical protein n=1 Tax=Parasphingorhabdus sp. TaxID=2709688 RepID=UPI0030B49C52|nr:hypothetical protein [Sphingomonadales bacterium]